MYYISTKDVGQLVDNTVAFYNPISVYIDSYWNCLTFAWTKRFFPFYSDDIQLRRNDSFDLFHTVFYSVRLNLSIDGTVLMKKQPRKIPWQEVWRGTIIAAVVCWKGYSNAILHTVIGFPLLLPFALSQCFPCHSKHEEAFSQAWNSLHGRITS